MQIAFFTSVQFKIQQSLTPPPPSPQSHRDPSFSADPKQWSTASGSLRPVRVPPSVSALERNHRLLRTFSALGDPIWDF